MKGGKHPGEKDRTDWTHTVYLLHLHTYILTHLDNTYVYRSTLPGQRTYELVDKLSLAPWPPVNIKLSAQYLKLIRAACSVHLPLTFSLLWSLPMKLFTPFTSVKLQHAHWFILRALINTACAWAVQSSIKSESNSYEHACTNYVMPGPTF
jgi:hypothetical protein